MQWVICTKRREQYGQDLTGPFETYDDAEEVFVTMGPASDFEHKYIIEMFTPKEAAYIEIVTRMAEWESKGFICRLFSGSLGDQELGVGFGGCQVNETGGFIYGRP